MLNACRSLLFFLELCVDNVVRTACACARTYRFLVNTRAFRSTSSLAGRLVELLGDLVAFRLQLVVSGLDCILRLRRPRSFRSVSIFSVARWTVGPRSTLSPASRIVFSVCR